MNFRRKVRKTTPDCTDKGVFEDESVCVFGPLVELHWLGERLGNVQGIQFRSEISVFFLAAFAKFCKKKK